MVGRPSEELEDDLRRFSKKRPLGLILPCLYSELATQALAGIVEHLKSVDYLSEVIIGLDRANESEWLHAREYFSRLPQHVRILWNDGPRLRALDDRLEQHGLAPKEAGKGRNVWYCMGYSLASGLTAAVALHDCDIKTYDRSLLARLIYPVAHPGFSYRFCKGYYARVGEGKLGGRVNRLLVSPLLRALKTTFGYSEYLEYMDSFRYPLAGEFSFQTQVLGGLRIPSDWGLEIGVLSEIQRNHASRRICQVEICDLYDHKHQELSADDPEAGLAKMSTDITKALFRKLATQGTVFTSESFRTIKATYYRTALDMVEAYHCDAVMNGLIYDRHSEEKAVEMFTESIMRAGDLFLQSPMETPFIPTWQRVQSAVGDFMGDFYDAVEMDNR